MTKRLVLKAKMPIYLYIFFFINRNCHVNAVPNQQETRRLTYYSLDLFFISFDNLMSIFRKKIFVLVCNNGSYNVIS